MRDRGVREIFIRGERNARLRNRAVITSYTSVLRHKVVVNCVIYSLNIDAKTIERVVYIDTAENMNLRIWK